MKRTIISRQFIKSAASIPAGLSAAAAIGVQPSHAAQTDAAETALPTIPLGKYHISRLIAGANPQSGYSHLSHFVDLSMNEYYTEDVEVDFLHRCQRAGINIWQSSGEDNFRRYERFRKEGGNLLYLSLSAYYGPSGKPGLFHGMTEKQAAKAGFIGIAHHGESTDRLFKEGNIDQVHEYLKRVRDAGLLVGLSTHMPAVIDYVEDKDWDVDFYMTCVYERHRSREKLKQLLGYVPLPLNEIYIEEDPPRMYERIRATRKTCLAFKILAAGRLCQSRKQVEDVFRATFENIKPTDAVIVGMFPRWSDQISENAGLVRKYG